MVVLVGIPGSGKSFVANQFRQRDWVIVSQDELGNRRTCEQKAELALAQGRSVVIDRTNFDQQQR
jgi:predicted kinase